MDGLRRFHDHLLRGRLSRHVERSPLPFGRHRWVSPNDAPEIEIATARPREEFGEWLREQANTPLDYEHGPAWHLAVLPFTDGGTGLSLVISHGLTDGVGLTTALADAASGHDDSISWPTAGSRRRWRALRQDARQTARDTSAVGQGDRRPARGWPGMAVRRRPPARRSLRRSRPRMSRSTSRSRPCSSTWTTGTPAPSHSAAPAIHFSQGSRQSLPSGSAESRPAKGWPPCRCRSINA